MNKNNTLLFLCFTGIASTAFASEIPVLEEVIVTAQKRTQSIQNVAGAISAFGESQIENRWISRVEDIYQTVPGLNYSEHAGNDLISIRGIGLQVDTGVAEPGVASHIDGIFQARTSMSGVETVDLERIEVLRGPQGTLYGRNATGGVINFITIKPTEDFSAGVTVGAGDWDMVKANGYVSGALIKGKVLGRISGWYEDHDGYIDNLGSGDDELGDVSNKGGRATLRFTPSENLLIDFSGSYHEEKYHSIQQNLDLDQPSIFSYLGLTTAPGVIITDKPNATVQNAPNPQGEKDTTAFTLIADWDISDAITLRSLTGYNDHSQDPEWYNADASSLELLNVGSPDNPRKASSDAWSQEINLSGVALGEKLNWVAGLYYFEEDFDASIPIYFQGTASLIFGGQGYAPGIALNQLIQRASENTQSSAAFIDLTYAVLPDFRVNFGVRYSDDEKHIKQTVGSIVTNQLPVDVSLPGGGPVIPAKATVSVLSCEGSQPEAGSGNNKLSWDSTSPKLRLEWDAAETILLYAQWQEGFKSGGVNLSSCDDTFKPENISAWELGMKSTFLDGAMSFNVASYFYKYDDLQVMTFDETGTSALIENVPESEITGAEIELAWAVSSIISLDSSLAYADSKITEANPIFDSVALLNNLTQGITDPALAIEDPNGNPLPRTPKFTGSLGINLSFPSDMGMFGLRGEVYYQDDTQYRLFDNPEDEADSYTVGNIYGSYITPSGNIAVRAFVKNVSNEEYLYQIIHAIPSGKQGNYAPPRHWGVELSYTF